MRSIPESKLVSNASHTNFAHVVLFEFEEKLPIDTVSQKNSIRENERYSLGEVSKIHNSELFCNIMSNTSGLSRYEPVLDKMHPQLL